MTPIVCFRCGGPIPTDRPHRGNAGRGRLDGTPRRPARRYCSDACREAQLRDDHRNDLRSVREYRTCRWCHALFLPREGRQVYCTEDCAASWAHHDHQSRLELARRLREGA
jgi:hypothetical protein